MKKTILGLLISIIVFGAACQKKTETLTNQTVTNSMTNEQPGVISAEEVLELQNLGGVTFAAHNQSTQSAGDIQMSKKYLNIAAGRAVPVFMFGQALPGRTTTQLNPNLEFGGLRTPVTVISAINGIVGFVSQQTDSNDYEVFLHPTKNSIWTVSYDHLTDVTVKQGDRVTVGQVLGKAARENNGMYRYELQVNKDLNGVTTFHCPTELLTPAVKVAQVMAINQFIQDWNTMFGSNIYGLITTACLKPVLTVDETH